VDREFQTKTIPADVKFTVGDYPENTYARGKRTLYVIGEPDIEEISRRLAQYDGEEITHIYFGSGHSFKVSTTEDMSPWTETITHFLILHYWCTLDFDNTFSRYVLESEMCSYNKFIPLISMKLPFFADFGYNAAIKIDDLDFNYSNYGTWTHSVHYLTSPEVFTSWDEYKDDIVLEEKNDEKN